MSNIRIMAVLRKAIEKMGKSRKFLQMDARNLLAWIERTYQIPSLMKERKKLTRHIYHCEISDHWDKKKILQATSSGGHIIYILINIIYKYILNNFI